MDLDNRPNQDVNLAQWDFDEVIERVNSHDLSLDDVDEILNGHAELVDRRQVDVDRSMPPYKLLAERYAMDSSEAYRKKMDVYTEDMEQMIPEGVEEGKKPVRLNHWKKELPNFKTEDGLVKYRHHYLAAMPDQQEVVAHYTWTDYETIELED